MPRAVALDLDTVVRERDDYQALVDTLALDFGRDLPLNPHLDLAFALADELSDADGPAHHRARHFSRGREGRVDLDLDLVRDLSRTYVVAPETARNHAALAQVDLTKRANRLLSNESGLDSGATYLAWLTLQWWRWIVIAWAISEPVNASDVRVRPEHMEGFEAQAAVRAVEEPFQRLGNLANDDATPGIESDLIKSKIQQIQAWQHDPHPNPQVYELHLKDIVSEISERLRPGSAIADLLRSDYGVEDSVADDIGRRVDSSYEQWKRLGDDDPMVSGDALAQSEKELIGADQAIRTASSVLAEEVQQYEESLKARAGRRAGQEAGIEVVEVATQAGIRATVRVLMDKLPDWKAAGLNLIGMPPVFGAR